MHKESRPDQSRVADFLAHPRRALWRLSLPILGGMAIHTLYSVVDMMFVGWVGPDALDLQDEITITEVSSDYFKEEYFAERPASERPVNKKLTLRKLNNMRDRLIIELAHATGSFLILAPQPLSRALFREPVLALEDSHIYFDQMGEI